MMRVGLALALSCAMVSVAMVPVAACQVTAVEPLQILRELRADAMGTSLLLEAIGSDTHALDGALVAARDELVRVEDGMTTWRDSELTRLNTLAGEGPIHVSPELCELVARALAIAELTDGAFDPTWHSVGKLWDFKAQPPVVPDDEKIAAALVHVDYRKVKCDVDQSLIELPTGTTLGLGGIAKGYGVDRAMAVLMERGVRHGVVDAGGDMKCLGQKLGEPWQIAIKHPRRRKDVMAVVPIQNRCVVTSGDYERFFEHDGVRYHHIIDPRTGRPASGCMSATVIGPDAAFCDALATAMCVLGPKRGLAIIESLDRVEALLVGMDGEVQASSGLPTKSQNEPGGG